MNVKKIVKNIKGADMKFSFPKDEEEKKLSDTIGNVLLNCLSAFPITHRREVFMVQKLGNKILTGLDTETGAVEISDREKKFLETVIDSATYRKAEGKTECEGIYLPVVIAQVMEEVGIIDESKE